MLRILWRFRAKASRLEDFRRTYGRDGEWAKLFARDADYRGTELLQDTTNRLVFVVVDSWAAEDSFTRFREQFGHDYERLDEQCRELTEEEMRIGVFTVEVE